MERQAFLERLRVHLSPAPGERDEGGMRAEGMRAEGMRAEGMRAEGMRAEASRAAQESAGQTRGMQVQPATTVGSPDRPVAGSRECTALFVTRLRELGVEVEVVASLGAARRALERLVGERDWGSVACAPGLRWEAIAERWTVEARDASFGLCEADWAVAETGSVVVCSSAEVRRGYSLVPPAVGFFVFQRRIVPTVGDVLRELPTDGHALPSCVSFVSGPSSTSDLAAVHVVGVHGPGEVFVWVIERADDRDDATGT